MKKVLISTAVTIASLFLLTIVLVVGADPFFHYHGPADMNKVYLYNEVYQTPGMARNFKYDTVMLGSSMTENFKVSWFTDYGQNCVKLCYSGARSKDIGNLLEQVFASGNKVTKIYIDINDYQISSEPDSVFGEVPEYLYDRNPFNDVQYVFNQDVWFESFDVLTAPASRGNYDDAFCWEDAAFFGKERVLEDLNGSHEDEAWMAENAKAGKESLEYVDTNMENILKYVKAHPETEFVFFYPPYSAAYWYDLKQQGVLGYKITAYRKSIEEILKCANADVYFFMDDYETITNLDLYRDMCHFNSDINRKMLEDMNKGTYKIGPLDYTERLLDLENFADSYEIN